MDIQSAGTSMKMYEKISSYIRAIISKNDRDFNLKKGVGMGLFY
jgi:hypothetical protein